MSLFALVCLFVYSVNWMLIFDRFVLIIACVPHEIFDCISHITFCFGLCFCALGELDVDF